MQSEQNRANLRNPIKKMRLMVINLILVLVGVIAVQVNAGGFDNIRFGGSSTDSFDDEMKSLFNTQINLSLKYLYTSVGFGNQKLERPGMSKQLRELADVHWEEGLKLIKKYFQRGGSTRSLYGGSAFSFHGKNEVAEARHGRTNPKTQYLNIIKTLVQDSRDCSSKMNRLHKTVVDSTEYHDADWGHFLEERLEKEEERSREMMGQLTNMEKMVSSSLAVHLFDSSL